MFLFFLHPVHETDTAWLACLGATLLLIVASPRDIHHAMTNVEWDTLLFFVALFTMIAATSELGLIRAIATGMTSIIQGSEPENQLTVTCMLLLWASALVSAFLANIPYTMTMVPIVKVLAVDLDLPIKPLVISLAFGACLGGSGTVVGSSANLIMAGVADTAGHPIGFIRFMKLGLPTVLLSVSITSLYLYMFYL